MSGTLGGYAIRTTRTVQKADTKKNEIIVNPKFLEAAAIVEDSYWSSILEKNAKNKFPTGFKYQENNLIYRKGATFDSLYLGNLDIKDFTNKCIEFYKRFTRMKSTKEMGIQNIESDAKRTIKRDQISSNWQKRMVNNDRVQLVLHYARKLERELNLNEELSKQLKNGLYYATISREFDNSSVTFRDGEVKHIEGIKIDKENNKVVFNFKKQRKSEAKAKIVEKQTLREKWETFVKICAGDDVVEEENDETTTNYTTIATTRTTIKK